MKNVKHESTQVSGGRCGGGEKTRSDRKTTWVSGVTAAEIVRKILTRFTVSEKTECHIQASRSQEQQQSHLLGRFLIQVRRVHETKKEKKYRPSCS